MTSQRNLKASFLLVLLGLCLYFFQLPTKSVAMSQKMPSETPLLQLSDGITGTNSIYLPIILEGSPVVLSPFGLETHARLDSDSAFLQHSIDLGVEWIRLGDRISWFDLQPEENGAIQWELLEDFEAELRALRLAGITPVVVVKYAPYWATVHETSCAALREDAFDDFATFMAALVSRYKTSEFNVHHWELGNEPDVAYDIVPTDNLFGCWGDRDDSYYGGREYGEMLKVVAPAIRAADSKSTIWFGGLLLDTPETTNVDAGRPERFLLGALTVQAAESFDILAYHTYGLYQNSTIDHDNASDSPWDAYGGLVEGKAAYLRTLMASFNVDKPLFINEISLACPEYQAERCLPPEEPFDEAQANHLVRSMVRGLSQNIMGFIWYQLEGPGWRHVGLLDGAGNPKAAYLTYQQLIQQLSNVEYISTANYGEEGLEAYIFQRGSEDVHVVWAKTNETLTISIPQSQFIAAYSRDGSELSATSIGSDMQLPVGFEPVYIIRTAAR